MKKRIPVILRSTIETKISIVGIVICGLVAILLIHLVLLFFTRFTLWPEMVVYPYLLNHGFSLYRDIINPYPPLLAFKLSVFSGLFGYQPVPYQIITWLLILIIDIAIFLGAAKITKSAKTALLSTIFFVILSIPFGINGLWYDLVQTPLIIVAVYFFARHFDKKSDKIDLFISAIALAAAFFIKQQALWLILFFLAVLIYRKRKDKKNLVHPVFTIIAPIVIGFGLEIFFLLPKGLLEDFFFWTITFPFFKASQMPGYLLLPTPRQALIVLALFLVFVPVILKRNLAQTFFLLTALVLLLFAYPRFDYFHLIPSLSILSLVFGREIQNFRKSKSPAVLISVTALIFLSIFTMRYLQRNWVREVRFFEPQIYQASKVLKQTAPDNMSIYIQNGPDQILPLAAVLPTKPWAIQFPWYLEIGKTQERILTGISSQEPQFIIYKPYDTGPKYGIGTYRPAKIADYLDNHYKDLIQISDTLWLKKRIDQ